MRGAAVENHDAMLVRARMDDDFCHRFLTLYNDDSYCIYQTCLFHFCYPLSTVLKVTLLTTTAAAAAAAAERSET